MLWVIDVGNTHVVFGLWDGSAWAQVWRLPTRVAATEDQLAAELGSLARLAGLPLRAEDVVIASVVPSVNDSLALLARKWLGVAPKFLTGGSPVGLTVRYEPASAVGADRLANALGALSLVPPPVVVVDFGTAITFDVIDEEGAYVGGAILPGLEVAASALAHRTAQLPQIQLRAPERAVGRSTPESLRSGLVFGFAGAIESLCARIAGELAAAPTVIATGGNGRRFLDLCPSLERYEPHLTLEGLRIAAGRLPAESSLH